VCVQHVERPENVSLQLYLFHGLPPLGNALVSSDWASINENHDRGRFNLFDQPLQTDAAFPNEVTPMPNDFRNGFKQDEDVAALNGVVSHSEAMTRLFLSAAMSSKRDV